MEQHACGSGPSYLDSPRGSLRAGLEACVRGSVLFVCCLQKHSVKIIHAKILSWVAAIDAMRTFLIWLGDPKSVGRFSWAVVVNPAREDVGCEFRSGLVAHKR